MDVAGSGPVRTDPGLISGILSFDAHRDGNLRTELPPSGRLPPSFAKNRLRARRGTNSSVLQHASPADVVGKHSPVLPWTPPTCHLPPTRTTPSFSSSAPPPSPRQSPLIYPSPCRSDEGRGNCVAAVLRDRTWLAFPATRAIQTLFPGGEMARDGPFARWGGYQDYIFDAGKIQIGVPMFPRFCPPLSYISSLTCHEGIVGREDDKPGVRHIKYIRAMG